MYHKSRRRQWRWKRGDPCLKALRKGNIETILHGSLWRAILAIAVPVVINSFLQTLYNLTDTYWLGRIGTEPLAAISLITPVQNAIVNFGSGFTVAGAVLIAQFTGAGLRSEAEKMANQIFLCSMCFSLLCVLMLEAFTPAIVRWLGAEGDTLRHAVIYMRVVALDIPFLFIVNLFQSVRQAQGDTVRPMLLNLLGISINLVLDPLLMVVWTLGAGGAALATVLAKMAPALLALYLLTRSGADVRLQPPLMKPEGDKLRQIVRIGLPSALGGCAMQLGFLLMSRNVFAYGVQAMAAYGIGNKVNGLISLPSNAIGSAAATIVGQNMGAGQLKRAEQGYRLSMIITVVFLFAGGMVLSRPAVSRSIVSIFATEEAVIGMAADFLSIMAFWCWTNGIHNATSGLFQGSGHTEVCMVIEMSRLWVLRFATLYFCEKVLRMGVRSVWYSVVASNGISAAILFGLYLTGLWRINRVKTR